MKPAVTPWYDYSYLPCQFCVGKNHCVQCGETIREALAAISGVEDVDVDAPNRRITIVYGEADPEDVEDQADAMGVFL